MKPLDGVLVVDLTQILSGPFATQILADLGARVIKVEAPTGDKARRNGPLVAGRSTYFASVNRGKQSLVLDLKKDAGKATFLDLVRAADVVVENFRPGTMARLGLDFARLAEVNPRLVYAACSGFGQRGPYAERPALDIVVQAMAGTMAITGLPDGPPVRVGFSVGDIGAGLYLAIGILAGLEQRRREGRAVSIDISMLHAQLALLENAFARYLATGQDPRPTGSRHPVLAPFQAFRAGDGRYLVVAASNDRHFVALAEAIGLPELAADARFVDLAGRVAHVDALEAMLAARFAERPAAEWLQRLQAAAVPCGPVHTVAEAAADSGVVQEDTLAEVEMEGVTLKVIGSPLRLNGRVPVRRARVPGLGEDGPTVLREVLGYPPEQIAALVREGVLG